MRVHRARKHEQLDGAIGGDRQDTSDCGLGVLTPDDEVHAGHEAESGACSETAAKLPLTMTAGEGDRGVGPQHNEAERRSRRIPWPWRVDFTAMPTPDVTVTLFACHPKRSAKQRYVVRGTLVAWAPAP